VAELPTLSLPVIESCQGCGACCTGVSLPPFIPLADEDEWEAFRRDHPVLVAEFQAEVDRRAREDDWPERGPCFWLDVETRQCRHYEQRPEICRDFAVGGEACLLWREAMAIWIKP
jgi:Fe-S-cluster containining protein